MALWRGADRSIAVAIFALGLVSRVVMMNFPRQCIFDEFHFGKFINGYLTGEYFFDIHPPLGKLLLALIAWLGGYKAEQGWEKIGESIAPDVNLFALRIGPAVQGAALAPLLFFAARALGLSRPAALVPAAGALFDLCALVEQRLVLTDATLFNGIALQLAASFASDHHAPLSRAWLGCMCAPLPMPARRICRGRARLPCVAWPPGLPHVLTPWRSPHLLPPPIRRATRATLMPAMAMPWPCHGHARPRLDPRSSPFLPLQRCSRRRDHTGCVHQVDWRLDRRCRRRPFARRPRPLTCPWCAMASVAARVRHMPPTPHASCLMLHATCDMSYATCLMPHARVQVCGTRQSAAAGTAARLPALLRAPPTPTALDRARGQIHDPSIPHEPGG